MSLGGDGMEPRHLHLITHLIFPDVRHLLRLTHKAEQRKHKEPIEKINIFT